MNYTNKILLSIIIPCYNVERYLDRCLKNIKTTAYEIILVDDGSTDKTSKICDEYNKYDNVKVFHKQNGGLSEARNFGLKKATGEYLIFLDSDDYINVDSLEKVLQFAIENQPDVIMCDFYKSMNNKILKQNSIKSDFCDTGINGLKKLILNNSYFPMVWKNLYKKSFIDENSLSFKVGFLHEDEDWTPRVLFKAKNVYFTRQAFYFYCLNHQSITHNKNDKNYSDVIQIVKDLRKDLKTKKNKELRIIDQYFINLYLASYIRCDYEKMYLKFNEITSLNLRIKFILCKYFRNIYKHIYLKKIMKTQNIY